MILSPEEKIDAEPIPPFGPTGLLPAQWPGRTTTKAGRDTSPYVCHPMHLVHRYGFSEERRVLLRKFFEWRAAIYAMGIRRGANLIGGSFVDDCEAMRGRPPADIDVLTVYGDALGLDSTPLLRLNDELHDGAGKARFGVDAKLIALGYQPPLFAFTWAMNFTQLLSRDRSGMQRGLLLISFMPEQEARVLGALKTP